jgi:hypothetical protein
MPIFEQSQPGASAGARYFVDVAKHDLLRHCERALVRKNRVLD